MPVKNYTNEELEHIAEDFLSRRAQGKYDGRSLRIESLIESLGYYIFSVPGLAEIAEAYVPAMPGYIFVDEDQYQQSVISFRWRFTIAEELAHILIHRPLFEGKSAAEITEIQQAFSDEEYRIIEKNAKYLAGSILMPMEVFQSRFEYFADIQYQKKVVNSLKILKYIVRQLSMDFNVSCHAVSMRSMQLGLIDQQQLEDLQECF
jgi:hypothetical protein